MFNKAAFGILLLFTVLCIEAAAHEEPIPVILDTDMALDDVRALALIVNDPDIQIKAIVTSDGSSSPSVGFQNLLKILEFLGASDTPAGMGSDLNLPAPRWRFHSEALGWADLPDAPAPDPVPDAVSVIINAFQETDRKIIYVCLSPLTNLADAIRRDPSIRHRIESVLFYGTPHWHFKPGWNTERDMKSAREVFSSGIPIYAFEAKTTKLFTFDLGLYREIQETHSRSSMLIDKLHQDWRIQKLLHEVHLGGWDETVALYMHDPSLGEFDQIDGPLPIFVMSRWDQEAARSSYLEMLAMGDEQTITARIPVILERYPTNPKDFKEDLRELIPEIISRHGREEWEATFLTNEFHRHLGIYSILGAKMGIRAREILSASLDSLQVESHAGFEPPVSCLNDGLQVATGASLGRGTIRVIGEATVPAAVFILGEKRLRLRIKDHVLKQIRSDIGAIIERCGASSADYWREIRELSFRYWVEMDRSEIFDETMENQRAQR
jgi:pyrimidine-specific ribonucleoside hydrolase